MIPFKVNQGENIRLNQVNQSNITFTNAEKENLYAMYYDTYAKIDGKGFSKDEFIEKFNGKYDTFFIEKSPSGEILNVCICNKKNNENGTKICLIFGKTDKETSKARVELVKKLLSNEKEHMYLEASGPIASILIKDKNIPISLVTESSEGTAHYSSLKTRHGKKIMFGYPKLSSPVSENMKEFYVNLYEYNKIKLKSKDLSREELSSQLVSLFNIVEHSETPSVYKGIILSKIARKHSEIDPQSSESSKLESRAIDLLAKTNVLDIDLVFAKGAPSHDETEFLTEMLGGKIEKLKEKHIDTRNKV
jgi:hypothetical protein